MINHMDPNYSNIHPSGNVLADNDAGCYIYTKTSVLGDHDSPRHLTTKVKADRDS